MTKQVRESQMIAKNRAGLNLDSTFLIGSAFSARLSNGPQAT